MDAPCSGEGMFRKEPEALRQHSAALVAQCAALGASILTTRPQRCGPAACCVIPPVPSRPEDEAQVGAFSGAASGVHGAARADERGRARGGGPMRRTLRGRAYPAHLPCHGGEGHFMALLQKRGTARRRSGQASRAARASAAQKRGRDMRACRPVQGGSSVSRAEARAEGRAFLCSISPGAAQLPLECRGTELFVLPGKDAADGRPARGAGGRMRGQRGTGTFVPAHHLFMAYGAQCANAERLTLADPARPRGFAARAIRERLAAAPGWAAVLADGFPLGFGKQSRGRGENHYPKGLRNLK